MLKKFTEFSNDRKNESNDSKCYIPKVKIEPEAKPVNNSETNKSKKVCNCKDENIVFEGKIVQFPINTKISSAYKLLEDKKVSKEKLHYIISEANKNTLIIAKYNKKAKIKLLEFVKTLIDVYGKNKLLKEHFSQIKLDGNDTYCIIMNIPEKAVTLLNKDLVKLLSK